MAGARRPEVLEEGIFREGAQEPEGSEDNLDAEGAPPQPEDL